MLCNFVRSKSLAVRGLLVVVAVSGLAACSGAPWVDSRREAGTLRTVGKSTPDRPAICHAGDATMAELQALATAECAKAGRTAVYVGTEKWQCRMTTPNRSVFECR